MRQSAQQASKFLLVPVTYIDRSLLLIRGGRSVHHDTPHTISTLAPYSRALKWSILNNHDSELTAVGLIGHHHRTATADRMFRIDSHHPDPNESCSVQHLTLTVVFRSSQLEENWVS
jgi:hypothetical protein